VYRVAIRVQHFEAIVDDRVDARVGWTITRSDDTRNAICHAAVSAPAGKAIDGLVQGVQEVVAQASERIAGQLLELQASGRATCPPGASAPTAGSPRP
jgi:uncharacterized lipoprotein YmbA